MKKIILALSILVILGGFASAFPYTGLIIDAHGLGIQPGMSPKIYDTEGREIYGTMDINPDIVIERGIVSYVDTIGQAIEEGLVGENPIVIRALYSGESPLKDDLIILKEDGDRIKEANDKNNFLKELKVAIIL